MAMQNSSAASVKVVDRIGDLGKSLEEFIANVLAAEAQGHHIVVRDGSFDTTTSSGQVVVGLLRGVQMAVDGVKK
ncbi:hypothetical protein G7048_23610 [Diaphorobacter sp. HDW4B]|uniref:hypothetical protein n=1 Tax=Diaphorobacter sp. HDW4B TaxID=2714925 RepID=UPI0014087BA4|nr:hypothetical protein [Diaphorobacter sp. HDW4B]QIL73075.1 hypothetical protein G7048_23610 [Diaphorobacter sp. HDW4B]